MMSVQTSEDAFTQSISTLRRLLLKNNAAAATAARGMIHTATTTATTTTTTTGTTTTATNTTCATTSATLTDSTKALLEQAQDAAARERALRLTMEKTLRDYQERMEETMRQREQEKEQLEQELDRMREQREQETYALQQTISSLELNLRDHDQQSLKLKETIEQLNQELNKAKTRMDQVQDQLLESNYRLKESEETVSDLQTQLDELERIDSEEIQKKDALVKKKERLIQLYRTKVERLQTELLTRRREAGEYMALEGEGEDMLIDGEENMEITETNAEYDDDDDDEEAMEAESLSLHGDHEANNEGEEENDDDSTSLKELAVNDDESSSPHHSDDDTVVGDDGDDKHGGDNAEAVANHMEHNVVGTSQRIHLGSDLNEPRGHACYSDDNDAKSSQDYESDDLREEIVILDDSSEPDETVGLHATEEKSAASDSEGNDDEHGVDDDQDNQSGETEEYISDNDSVEAVEGEAGLVLSKKRDRNEESCGEENSEENREELEGEDTPQTKKQKDFEDDCRLGEV